MSFCVGAPNEKSAFISCIFYFWRVTSSQPVGQKCEKWRNSLKIGFSSSTNIDEWEPSNKVKISKILTFFGDNANFSATRNRFDQENFFLSTHRQVEKSRQNELPPSNINFYKLLKWPKSGKCSLEVTTLPMAAFFVSIRLLVVYFFSLNDRVSKNV